MSKFLFFCWGCCLLAALLVLVMLRGQDASMLVAFLVLLGTLNFLGACMVSGLEGTRKDIAELQRQQSTSDLPTLRDQLPR